MDFNKKNLKDNIEIYKQEIFYESLVNNSPIAIVTMDANQKIISVNPAFTSLFQFTQEEAHLKDLDTLIAKGDNFDQAQGFTKQVLDGGKIHGTGKRRRKDGTLIDVEMYGVPIFLEGERIGVLGMYIDITDRLKSEELIKRNELRYRSLFQDSPISMWELDFSRLKQWVESLELKDQEDLLSYLKQYPNLEKVFLSLINIIDVNQATLSLFRAKSLEDLRCKIQKVVIEQSANSICTIIFSLFNGAHQVETEMAFSSLDGMVIHTITRLSLFKGNKGDWTRVHLLILDITERKYAEERLRYLTMHDSMTGLYNRYFFETELKRLSRGRQYPISIIICDLDNLKKTNDHYGHPAGDAIICKTANILQENFRGDDIVARLGGDEFAVVISGLDEAVVVKIIDRLRKNIENHNALLPSDTHSSRINLSIGFATAQAGTEVEKIFKLADQHMYSEKASKRNEAL